MGKSSTMTAMKKLKRIALLVWVFVFSMTIAFAVYTWINPAPFKLFKWFTAR